MLTFNSRYFALAVILFVVEVLIAVYVNDGFVRPYLGDFLVVIFMYCCIKSFLRASVKTVAVLVLLFAYCIEVLQYFNLVKLLGLQHSTLARVVLGTSFTWTDLLAYTLGILLVLFVEAKAQKRQYLVLAELLT